MPKSATARKSPALELTESQFEVKIKLPLKLRPQNIDWKRFLPRNITQVVVVLLVLAVGFLFYQLQSLEKNQIGNLVAVPSGSGQPTPTQPTKVNVAVGNFPVLGNTNAKVTMIEFADFRCPFCEQWFTNTEPQFIKDYVDTGKVKFAFRNFAFLGPASTVAADAAECANDQGKFWDFHNYLYKNQPAETDTSMYNTDTLTQAAVNLGMTDSTFRTCLDNKTDDAKAAKDMSDGQAAGVSGTPSFFINGTPIIGACPFATIKGAVDAEIAHKQWSVDAQCKLTVQ